MKIRIIILMARFVNENTILYEYDPFDEGEPYLLEAYEKHYQELRQAKNIDGKPFQLIPVPVTRKVVKEADCKGSYLNFTLVMKLYWYLYTVMNMIN